MLLVIFGVNILKCLFRCNYAYYLCTAKRRPYFTVKGMDRAVEMIKNQHTEEGWRETGGTSKWIFLAGLGLQPTNNMSGMLNILC